MELKKGMYVRINNDIRKICIGIGKIKQINQDTIYVEMNIELPISFGKNEISKSSPNIIDLIEVGDYVNGNPVCLIKEDEHNRKWIYTDSNYKCGYLEEDIETILTHEQFKKMMYKIGDIDE